jgi:hypothetical protein
MTRDWYAQMGIPWHGFVIIFKDRKGRWVIKYAAPGMRFVAQSVDTVKKKRKRL